MVQYCLEHNLKQINVSPQLRITRYKEVHSTTLVLLQLLAAWPLSFIYKRHLQFIKIFFIGIKRYL